ncbi:methylated-DNA--[protein]-cysteine S-methyltransferase [Dyella subtropica]|uniref:methylated-DNA--[protein]-cysteine S-methyltransferase n=1 Tax=Dyella subtropica TaxID=2992127 RepID=UPI0022561746|nr:methylated-DNA--[protein]-cysteine S-methyltransferase [Dyella subtropica]
MNLSTKHMPLAAATQSDPRWAQVLKHDASADGNFWYSVRTTGVYCRPSCAARPARPENVAFHATREDAERAGFRPCKRCHPERDIATKESIRYTIAPNALGQLLVAQSETGICAILLGDDAALLTKELQQRFPQATLQMEPKGLQAQVAKVAHAITTHSHGQDLTFDLRGTPFQRKVWEALRAIPAGTTASYTEIARRIGAPRAVRAVAQACASNALAVLIPCHRVVRSDGGLSGYRWGVERKRALLAQEARA